MAQMFNDQNFNTEVLESPIPVLVDFWAVWCGPCRMMGPIVDKISDEYAGKIKVGKLNVDENSIIPQKYEIQGIPAFIIFKNGKIVTEFAGAMSEDNFKNKINAIL